MNKGKSLIFALIVIASGVVYAITLCPTVELIDSGELAMAAKNLGIAHPTGYPLYTLLGRIFAMLPFGSLILRLNFLSLLFTAFATGFLYLLISEFVSEKNAGIIEESVSAAAALFVAFSPVWWDQGTTNEVYSLNLLLISISIWGLAKYTRGSPVRWLILAVYMLGLSLANHLSAIYLIPGFLYMIYITLKQQRIKRSLITYTIVFFVFPATLYAVLPIRASFKPFLNWGAVNDPYFFYKHITGWQYRVWMFTKPFEIFNNFGAKIAPAWKLFIGQFGWIGFFIIIIGIIAGIRHQRKLLIFAGLIWIVNLIYVLNYDIVDIESYYLPMFLICAIFMAMGLLYLAGIIVGFVSGQQPNMTPLVLGIICVSIVLPLYNLLANFHEDDRRGKTAARQGVYDMTASMEPGGLALVENWDFYSPWLYLHFEENYKPDMAMLDKELMRRSWYIDFIRREFSDIYEGSRPEFEEFVRQVLPFERGRTYDGLAIDRAYYAMLHAVIDNESKLRPVYTNIVDDPKFMTGYDPYPAGILYRLSFAREFVECPRFSFDEVYWERQSDYDPKRMANFLLTYAKAFQSREKFCDYFGKQDEAAYYGKLGDEAMTLVKRDYPVPKQ